MDTTANAAPAHDESSGVPHPVENGDDGGVHEPGPDNLNDEVGYLELPTPEGETEVMAGSWRWAQF